MQECRGTNPQLYLSAVTPWRVCRTGIERICPRWNKQAAACMVSNPEQSAIRQKARLGTMVENTRIVSAKLEGEYGLIVTFTDGTEDAYTVEELLELRPCRDLVRKPMESKPLLW